jgi:hypothetical protein
MISENVMGVRRLDGPAGSVTGWAGAIKETTNNNPNQMRSLFMQISAEKI